MISPKNGFNLIKHSVIISAIVSGESALSLPSHTPIKTQAKYIFKENGLPFPSSGAWSINKRYSFFPLFIISFISGGDNRSFRLFFILPLKNSNKKYFVSLSHRLVCMFYTFGIKHSNSCVKPFCKNRLPIIPSQKINIFFFRPLMFKLYSRNFSICTTKYGFLCPYACE